MTTLSFRTAALEDLPIVVGLLADDRLGAQRERPGEPLHHRYVEAFGDMQRSGCEVILAERRTSEEVRVVGCVQYRVLAGLAFQGARRAQVEGVRIAGDLRGQGLGRTLINHVIARSRADGCHMLQFVVHESRSDARRFYESLGFVPSHVGYKMTL